MRTAWLRLLRKSLVTATMTAAQWDIHKGYPMDLAVGWLWRLRPQLSMATSRAVDVAPLPST